MNNKLIDKKYEDINLTAYFTDSTFSKKDENNILIKELKFQKKILLFGNVNNDNYKYLYVEITPIGNFTDVENSFFGLEIRSNTEPFSHKFQTLGPSKYFYAKMDKKTNQFSYILKGIKTNNEMYIEFASCSNETFEIVFQKEIDDDEPTVISYTKEENYGRTLYHITDTNSTLYVNMTILRKEKNENLEEDSFYVVKYVCIEKYAMYTQYYTSSPISAEYSSTNNNISIFWGGMHDQKDYYVSPIFYISFYDTKKLNF